MKNSKETFFPHEGKNIQLIFRKVKRAKRIRIHISSASKILVTASPIVPYKAMELFFHSQKKWIHQMLEHFEKHPNKCLKLSEEEYKKIKEKAREIVHEKLSYWNQYYCFRWKRVAIRNTKTRWGSCSSQGTLSFHAGIVTLPEVLQDYLIVHELCHIEAMNHGSNFWKLAEKALPNAKLLDKRLKKYSGESIL